MQIFPQSCSHEHLLYQNVVAVYQQQNAAAAAAAVVVNDVSAVVEIVKLGPVCHPLMFASPPLSGF
jgi:hypothetical protein